MVSLSQSELYYNLNISNGLKSDCMQHPKVSGEPLHTLCPEGRPQGQVASTERVLSQVPNACRLQTHSTHAGPGGGLSSIGKTPWVSLANSTVQIGEHILNKLAHSLIIYGWGVYMGDVITVSSQLCIIHSLCHGGLMLIPDYC